MKILMCVPNISDEENLEIVETVVNEVRQVDGVKLLDYSSDADHNRSVLSYLGEPEQVLEATKKMAAKALELIDMRNHKGPIREWGLSMWCRLSRYEMWQPRKPSKLYGVSVVSWGIWVYRFIITKMRPPGPNGLIW